MVSSTRSMRHSYVQDSLLSKLDWPFNSYSGSAYSFPENLFSQYLPSPTKAEEKQMLMQWRRAETESIYGDHLDWINLVNRRTSILGSPCQIKIMLVDRVHPEHLDTKICFKCKPVSTCNKLIFALRLICDSVPSRRLLCSLIEAEISNSAHD